MREGGRRLREIKQQLVDFTQVGTTFEAIEAKAQELIKAGGDQANFAMVEGYHWATCIMKNDELCHGIPKGKVVNEGDVITIDVGLLHDSYHLDTSVTFAVGKVSGEVQKFLEIGRQSLKKAINKAQVGSSVYDISSAMERVVERAGYGAVYQLTGHGVGETLHGEPSIPCVAQRADKKVKLHQSQTLAIEIMYTMGDPHLTLDKDGWTYRTADGSLSGMFEETVLVTAQGPEILT